MSKGVVVWNPDLPEGPDNVRPAGNDQRLTPAQDWQDKNRTEGRTEIPGGKGGRKPVVIDWAVFAELCQLFCTKEEIAGFFKCSEDTIERACKKEFGDKYTFKVVWNELSAGGKISLRRAQAKLALKGNVLMQIWLGKQVLGQRDSPQPPAPDETELANQAVQDVYGTTFVGAAGQEVLPVNVPPPGAVLPSNAPQNDRPHAGAQ